MSEYWKSTPKYWCKHCKIYVKDTKLEKTNHEASPKHQGNLKRFLRDLHRDHERGEKDKERAKAEVARLNGITNGCAFNSTSAHMKFPSSAALSPQVTAAQRKQQLSQLAEMGVNIPDEFRSDMAMAGEWQVTSQRIIQEDMGINNIRPDSVAQGIRKRHSDGEDEEAMDIKRSKWEPTYISHPKNQVDEELDALLNKEINKKHEHSVKTEVDEGENMKEEQQTQKSTLQSFTGLCETSAAPAIKDELSDGRISLNTVSSLSAKQPGLDEQNVPGVIFKKRKAKHIRRK